MTDRIENPALKVTGTTRMTDEQRNTLNAACSDLAAQILWHGFRLSKDDWRHMLAGTMLGWRMMPGINLGEGPSFIMLGGSSLSLTKSQASDAITQAFAIGDDPSSQGLKCPPVRWCKAVCMARWIEQEEIEAVLAKREMIAKASQP